MVSLTAAVWSAIALWVLVALFAYSAFAIAARFDRTFDRLQPPVKLRKPRTRKAIDTGRRDDEAL